MGSTLGRNTQRSRHDQATQMSNRGSEKSALPNSASVHEKEKSSGCGGHVCKDCNRSSCVCGENYEDAKKSTSSRKMLKTINGEVFGTYLDVDFSSSEVA